MKAFSPHFNHLMEQYFKVSMSNGIHAKRSNTGTDGSHAYVNPIVTRQTVMQVGIPCHHFPPCFLPGKVSLLFPNRYQPGSASRLSVTYPATTYFQSSIPNCFDFMRSCCDVWIGEGSGSPWSRLSSNLGIYNFSTWYVDVMNLGWWWYEFPLNLQPGPNFEPLK